MSEDQIALKRLKEGCYCGSYCGEPVAVRKAGRRWWLVSRGWVVSGSSRKEAVREFLTKATKAAEAGLQELQELQE
jgi:hypothetical protein